MAFVVSARKYRPTKFREVVGQSNVSVTLKNAIKSDKLAQSFLFCGPRGVGKTTSARILARTLNCLNVQNIDGTTDIDDLLCNLNTQDEIPICESCRSFQQSASFNVFELDAASNNSVEDIRKLIEQVRFAPQSGKYKVYIIDEVHMLSQAAFNAFLKTLEEPPSYAIFILATTEKHKIIPTILSRCQIFDFSRITVQDIVAHLQTIALDQHITVQEDALHLIAQKADGGLRDALSIFDRIASFAEGEIKYHNVLDSLNILDYDYYFKATNALLAQDSASLLLLFNQVLQKGFEGNNFILGLSEHFRNLLVCKTPSTLSLLDVTEGLKQQYATQAILAPASLLLSALNVCNECNIQYRTAKNKRLQVELCLLKMCYINQAINLSQNPIPVPAQQQKRSSIVQAQLPSNVMEHKVQEPLKQVQNNPLPPPVSEKVAHNQAHNTDVVINLQPTVQTKTNNKQTVITDKPLSPPSTDASSKTVTEKPKTNYLAALKKKRREEEETKKTTEVVDKKIVADTELKADLLQKINDANTNSDEKNTTTKKQLNTNILLDIWKSYSKQLDKMTLKSLFDSSKPILNNETITVTVSSNMHLDLIQESLPGFVGFLYSIIGENDYTVNAVVDKKLTPVTVKAINHTPKQKYEDMLKINSDLLLLTKKLDLNIL